METKNLTECKTKRWRKGNQAKKIWKNAKHSIQTIYHTTNRSSRNSEKMEKREVLEAFLKESQKEEHAAQGWKSPPESILWVPDAPSSVRNPEGQG